MFGPGKKIVLYDLEELLKLVAKFELVQ